MPKIKPFTGAFIIPTGKYHNTKYLYVGIEAKGASKGQASAFGGKRNSNEKIQKCARREFQEESRGVFAKDKSIKKRLKNQNKHHVHKVDTNNTCVTYIVPLKIKENPMAKFSHSKGGNRSQREMSKIIAVKTADVIKTVHGTALGTPMTLMGNPVRPLLASVLREGVNKGYIKP